MNQIICTSNSNLDIPKYNKYYKKRYLFKIQLLILSIICILIIIYYICFRYSLYNSEKFAKNILDNLGLTQIYESSSDYNAKFLSQEKFFYENSSFSVIGSIEISKLDIYYPILSDINKDLLKISPCRFYGPMPNQVR